MPSSSQASGHFYTWTPKYGPNLWMRGVSPNGRTYQRCKDRAAQAYAYWAVNYGHFLDPNEIHHGISRSVTPILIDEHEGIGVWLIPYPEKRQSGPFWLADIMAFTFTLLEERWEIVCVGELLNKGDVMVAGPLSSNEVSDLGRGVFPETLLYLGKPGPRFAAAATLARRMSEPALNMDQEVMPTVAKEAGVAQSGYCSEDKRRAGLDPRLISVSPITSPSLPLRRAYSEPSLSVLASLPRQQPGYGIFPTDNEAMSDVSSESFIAWDIYSEEYC